MGRIDVIILNPPKSFQMGGFLVSNHPAYAVDQEDKIQQSTIALLLQIRLPVGR
jgi:hypothetical protein